MTTTNLRIGVGFGTKVHVPGFQSEGVEVVALCARRRESVERATGELGIPHVYTDYCEMLRHVGLDVISIATPMAFHHEMGMEALAAGKHVPFEKAFAMDQGQAGEMWQKAEQTGLTGMMAHELRFAPASAYLKELLHQGYVGEFRTVQTTLFMRSTRIPRPRPMTWDAP